MSVLYGKFQIPENITVDQESLTPTFGRFIAEPFERGFGHTVGNSLRRILLASLEAPAIISVKIEGGAHEYMAIDGVIEDMITIVLNIKGALLRRLPLEGETGSRRQRVIPTMLEVSEEDLKANDGQVKVTLGDLIQGGHYEVVNPELHLFTVTKPMKRCIDFRVAMGRGYVPSERLTIADKLVDEIVIDGLFSPIRLVSYKVENTRVGQDTDFDRLILDVVTDGRITAQEAVGFAAQIGSKHLNVFAQVEAAPVVFDKGEAIGDSEREEMLAKLSQRIGEIELSVRSTNCLNQAGISTIGELVVRRESEMLQFRNFGRKSLSEIRKWLEKLELGFGMDLSDYSITRDNVKEVLQKYMEEKEAEAAAQSV